MNNSTDLKFYSMLPNYGRARENMPQIDPDNILDFLLHFSRKSIPIKKVSYPLNKLRPAQKDVNVDKVRSKLMANDSNWRDRIYLISQDKFIVDGHHDFATGLEQEENYPVTCYKIDLPVGKLLKISNHLNITTNENMNGKKLNEEVNKLIVKVLTEAKKNTSKITGDKKVLYSAAQNRERERAKEQGFYDGRYRPKTEKDRSKYDAKKERQKKFSMDEAERDEDLSQYGIKELKDGLTLEVLKKKFAWVLNAKIKDAILGIKGNSLVWYNGVWESGKWIDGFWKNGVWKSGDWVNGIWYKGTWYKGTWKKKSTRPDNSWVDDITWGIKVMLKEQFDNITKKISLKEDVRPSIDPEPESVLLKRYGIKELKDGLTLVKIFRDFPWLLEAKMKNAVIGTNTAGFYIIWYKGDWLDGEWKDGLWKSGTWSKGIWRNGKWESGVWRNGEWRNGTWKDGLWIKGIWKDGYFEGGKWLNGHWKNGFWNGGEWVDGDWDDGAINFKRSDEPPHVLRGVLNYKL